MESAKKKSETHRIICNERNE